MRTLRTSLRTLAGDKRGTAALELTIVIVPAVLVMLNGTDAARYYFARMAVQNATQMAAQAALATCDSTHLPATTKCPGLNSAVSASIASTSLGNKVTLATGYPTEGYYCTNTGGALQKVSDVSSKPVDCSSVGSKSDQPGDYIVFRANYTYRAIFQGIGIGSLFPTSIVGTSTMRLL